jgi:TIR domain
VLPQPENRMSRPLVFISYRHGPRWTKLANALHLKLDAIADGAGFDLFLDSQDIRAGANWRTLIDDALERCTHFVSLLCDEYWARSNQCLRELYWAVNRYESQPAGPAPQPPRLPHLLFVLAAEMRTDLLKLDAARQRGDLSGLDPQLKAIGDINFLGPFDANQRLQSLNGQNPQRLDKQLAQLVDRLLATGGFAH